MYLFCEKSKWRYKAYIITGFPIQVRRKGSIPQEGEPQEQEPGGSLFATPSGTPPSGTTPTTPSGGEFLYLNKNARKIKCRVSFSIKKCAKS